MTTGPIPDASRFITLVDRTECKVTTANKTRKKERQTKKECGHLTNGKPNGAKGFNQVYTKVTRLALR